MPSIALNAREENIRPYERESITATLVGQANTRTNEVLQAARNAVEADTFLTQGLRPLTFVTHAKKMRIRSIKAERKRLSAFAKKNITWCIMTIPILPTTLKSTPPELAFCAQVILLVLSSAFFLLLMHNEPPFAFRIWGYL
jgi:hypothetical protein